MQRLLVCPSFASTMAAGYIKASSANSDPSFVPVLTELGIYHSLFVVETAGNQLWQR